MPSERLQKILARAGVASRRASEELITGGHVTVDGRCVTVLGAKADPDAQDIRLDGRRLRPEPFQYWLLNKPKGVLCTNFDPAGRRLAADLVAESGVRLFSVGRLDADSKGLLVMTNDGALANRLGHPRHEVPKTYLAAVSGRATEEDVRRVLRGVHLAEGRARAVRVRLLKRGRSRSILEIVLKEGRNRQIRRVLARLGHPVRDLVRTRIGHLSLKGLPIGQARRLTADEVQYLKGLGEQPAPPEQAPGAQRHAPGRAGRLTKARGAERRRRTFSREPKGERSPSRQAPGAKRRQPNDRHRP